MKKSKALRAVLFVAGLIAAGVGVAILLMAQQFHATIGIELRGNASLLSEVRAGGGALLASGILILLGVFVVRMRFTALLLSTLLYLSYGLSRLLSMAVDGMPAGILVQVTLLEIAIGLVCLLALVRIERLDRSRDAVTMVAGSCGDGAAGGSL